MMEEMLEILRFCLKDLKVATKVIRKRFKITNKRPQLIIIIWGMETFFFDFDIVMLLLNLGLRVSKFFR